MCFCCTAIPTVAALGVTQKIRLDREKREAQEQGAEPKQWALPIEPAIAVAAATGVVVTGLVALSVVIHTQS